MQNLQAPCQSDYVISGPGVALAGVTTVDIHAADSLAALPLPTGHVVSGFSAILITSYPSTAVVPPRIQATTVANGATVVDAATYNSYATVVGVSANASAPTPSFTCLTPNVAWLPVEAAQSSTLYYCTATYMAAQPTFIPVGMVVPFDTNTSANANVNANTSANANVNANTSANVNVNANANASAGAPVVGVHIPTTGPSKEPLAVVYGSRKVHTTCDDVPGAPVSCVCSYTSGTSGTSTSTSHTFLREGADGTKSCREVCAGGASGFLFSNANTNSANASSSLAFLVPSGTDSAWSCVDQSLPAGVMGGTSQWRLAAKPSSSAYGVCLTNSNGTASVVYGPSESPPVGCVPLLPPGRRLPLSAANPYLHSKAAVGVPPLARSLHSAVARSCSTPYPAFTVSNTAWANVGDMSSAMPGACVCQDAQTGAQFVIDGVTEWGVTCNDVCADTYGVYGGPFGATCVTPAPNFVVSNHFIYPQTSSVPPPLHGTPSPMACVTTDANGAARVWSGNDGNQPCELFTTRSNGIGQPARPPESAWFVPHAPFCSLFSGSTRGLLPSNQCPACQRAKTVQSVSLGGASGGGTSGGGTSGGANTSGAPPLSENCTCFDNAVANFGQPTAFGKITTAALGKAVKSTNNKSPGPGPRPGPVSAPTSLFIRTGNNGSVTCDQYCSDFTIGDGAAIAANVLGTAASRATELLGVGSVAPNAGTNTFGEEGFCVCESSLPTQQASRSSPPVFISPGNNGSMTCDDYCNNPAYNQGMVDAFKGAGYSGALASRRLRGIGDTLMNTPSQATFGAKNEGFCLCEATNTINFAAAAAPRAGAAGAAAVSSSLFIKAGNNGSVTCDEYCAVPSEGSGGALVANALGSAVVRAPELLGIVTASANAGLHTFGGEGFCVCESTPWPNAVLPPLFVKSGNNGSATCDAWCNDAASNEDMVTAFTTAGYSGGQSSRRLKGVGGLTFTPPSQSVFGSPDEGYCLCEATNDVTFYRTPSPNGPSPNGPSPNPNGPSPNPNGPSPNPNPNGPSLNPNGPSGVFAVMRGTHASGTVTGTTAIPVIKKISETPASAVKATTTTLGDSSSMVNMSSFFCKTDSDCRSSSGGSSDSKFCCLGTVRGMGGLCFDMNDVSCDVRKDGTPVLSQLKYYYPAQVVGDPTSQSGFNQLTFNFAAADGATRVLPADQVDFASTQSFDQTCSALMARVAAADGSVGNPACPPSTVPVPVGDQIGGCVLSQTDDGAQYGTYTFGCFDSIACGGPLGCAPGQTCNLLQQCTCNTVADCGASTQIGITMTCTDGACVRSANNELLQWQDGMARRLPYYDRWAEITTTQGTEAYLADPIPKDLNFNPGDYGSLMMMHTSTAANYQSEFPMPLTCFANITTSPITTDVGAGYTVSPNPVVVPSLRDFNATFNAEYCQSGKKTPSGVPNQYVWGPLPCKVGIYPEAVVVTDQVTTVDKGMYYIPPNQTGSVAPVTVDDYVLCQEPGGCATQPQYLFVGQCTPRLEYNWGNKYFLFASDHLKTDMAHAPVPMPPGDSQITTQAVPEYSMKPQLYTVPVDASLNPLVNVPGSYTMPADGQHPTGGACDNGDSLPGARNAKGQGLWAFNNYAYTLGGGGYFLPGGVSRPDLNIGYCVGDKRFTCAWERSDNVYVGCGPVIPFSACFHRGAVLSSDSPCHDDSPKGRGAPKYGTSCTDTHLSFDKACPPPPAPV